MRELLERWAKAEPTRCRPSLLSDPAPGPHVVLSGSWWSSGEYPNITPALVLAAVIEAIVSRRWTFELRLSHPGGVAVYSARIDRTPGEYLLGEPNRVAAAALLSAYLSALDHEAAVDEYGGTR